MSAVPAIGAESAPCQRGLQHQHSRPQRRWSVGRGQDRRAVGWIGTAVLAIVAGDINSAPVADPRTIPWAASRTGVWSTSVTSQMTGKLDNSGCVSAAAPVAPSSCWRTPRDTIFSLLGSHRRHLWLQVNFEGRSAGSPPSSSICSRGSASSINCPSMASSPTRSQSPAMARIPTPTRSKLMLARVELAAVSQLDSRHLDNIALGGRAQCADSRRAQRL